MKKNRYLSTDESAEGKSGEMAIVDAILIHMPNVDLNRSMVLSGNQSVCGRAAPNSQIHSNSKKKKNSTNKQPLNQNFPKTKN